MNMTLSLLPVILSFVITIGILYVPYTKFFIKYMNLKGDGKDKIISYSLLIGILTFGLGLTTVLNELFFVQFNNSTIQSKNIERGIFTLLFYPLVFWSLGFILHKVFKKQPRDVQLSEGTGFKLNTNTYLIGGGVLVLVTLLLVGTNNSEITPMNSTGSKITSTSSKDLSEKELNVKSCTLCSTDDKKCQNVEILKKIIVNKNEIIEIYVDGSMKTWKSDEHNCSIVVSKNFMFYCNSFNPLLNTKQTVKFDGEKKYEYEYVSLYSKTQYTGSHTLDCSTR